MNLRQRMIKAAVRPHLPRRTVRLRLTLLYGGLFLASGAVLLVITDVLWGNATKNQGDVAIWAVRGVIGDIVTRTPPPDLNPHVLKNFQNGAVSPVFGASRQTPVSGTQIRLVRNALAGFRTQQHSIDVHQLIIFSAIAIAIMALIAVVLGWLMAGRVLRPVRTITTAARDISVLNLHERLRLRGPDDELKELGDTFDCLLERLEGSFQSQRQFVANASHELRTPLATMRAALDVAMAKPARTPEQTSILADRLHEELVHMDQLLEGLLALARAERGSISDDATLSLDDFVSAAIGRRAPAISYMDIDVDHEQCPDAWVGGNEMLLSRMVGNIIDNSITHNDHGGWVRATTAVVGPCARLTVENGGQVIDEENIEELTQPFRRAGAERTRSDTGSGLGLSIVASVADAHGGRLELTALSGGGLRVVVELPLAARTLAGAMA